MASSNRAPAGPRRRWVLALIGAAATQIIPGAAVAAPRVHTVTIQSMTFGAVPQELRAGDVIEWVNADIFRHSATAKDGSFDADLPPKGRKRVTLRKPGAVAFFCRYHPGMTGRLLVSAARGR